MPEHEKRINEEGIENQPKRKKMERMEKVQENKVDDRQSAVFLSISGKNKTGHKNGFPDVAPGPTEIHFVHLAEFRRNGCIDDGI